MKLENIRVKEIDTAIRYITHSPKIDAKNRCNHMIGIQFSGQAIHDFGYKTLDLVKDSLYFFNQRDNYHANVIGHSSCFSIHFTTFFPIETDSFRLKINSPDIIIQFLEKIESATLQNPPNDNLALQHLYALFSYVNKLIKKEYAPSDDRAVIAKEYIDSHFMDNNCLKQVTEKCQISQRRLNELFKNTYNLTLNRYIVFCKINHAKKLLKLQYLSVAEISDLCGFSDMYYFSKVFKAETGISPSIFKKNNMS